jgi:3-carboxy-cis,cis-muconate cycloisomerase
MTATALDSAIFRDIFTTPAMREVFSDERRTGYYLEIEIALARAQSRLGIIPEKAAREIERQCRIENIDLARLKQQTERIGYPILGVVQQIIGLCADGLGEWCHWGATTQDITDTAAIMQIRAALELVEKDMEAIAAALADLSRRYRDTPMAGRSNLQQAVPLTFGFKTAALLGAMQRHRERLAQLRPRVRGRGRNAGLARRRWSQGASRDDGGAWSRPAGHRLAYGAGPYRRSRLFSRTPHRHARQDFHGREAPDADRGCRGL